MFKCITRQDSLAVMEASTVKKKIIVVGDGETGKTSLINRFSHDNFNNDSYLPTITDICVESIQYGGKPIELNLHDTAGQEDYGTFRPISYPGTDVVVVCFSLSSLISLENVSVNWVPEIRHFCGSIPIILVGTKVDLRESSDNFKNSKPVKYEDGCDMAYRINAVTYLECSSKLDKGVEDVFHAAVKASLTKQKKKRFF